MILENKDFKIIIGKNIPETDAPAKPEAIDKQELVYTIANTVAEGGFNPVSQLVGFIIADDPTHIANYNNARTLINRIDRDELLEDMVRVYLGVLEKKYGTKDSEDDD
ncbi:MAG: IreB family regulatory phosphoprotein [Clostridia bacterium]|nr:IreB family regulatory phosphoprotein [Clostridia bacterium]